LGCQFVERQTLESKKNEANLGISLRQSLEGHFKTAAVQQKSHILVVNENKNSALSIGFYSRRKPSMHHHEK
jgi:hypothetical protein